MFATGLQIEKASFSEPFQFAGLFQHENAARSRLRGLLSFLLCKGYHVKSIPGIGQSCKGGVIINQKKH